MADSGLDITLTFFFFIFVILDIFINVILVLAIRRKRSLQTPMNLLILHLAITDIVIGVFVTPRHILNYVIPYPKSAVSDYICKFITGGNFIWTSVTAASGFLTIIAMERLFAVVFPHKSQLRITKQRLKWLVGACWLSSLAFNLPSLLVLKYDHQNAFCMEYWPSWVNPKAYVGLAFFAGNFSVFAMYILYSIILYSLWKKNKGVSEVSRTARINARKRVTKMLVLMTVVHMFCRTPNYTFYTLIYFDPDATYGSIVYNFTVFLILLNSASHPFFYCWYMDNLRKQVFAMLPQFCLARCPARLRTFDIISTGDPGSNTGNDGRKGRGEVPFNSCTLGSESEAEEMRKKHMVKMTKTKGYINSEVEASDSSGDRSVIPNTEKKKITSQVNCQTTVTDHGQNGEKMENADGTAIDLDKVHEDNTPQSQIFNDNSLILSEQIKEIDDQQEEAQENIKENPTRDLQLPVGSDKEDVPNVINTSNNVTKNGYIMNNNNNNSASNSYKEDNNEFQNNDDNNSAIRTQDVIIETEAVDV